MHGFADGPASSLFSPIGLKGNGDLHELSKHGVSREMAAALPEAPGGSCVAWGIPFDIGKVVVIDKQTVTVEIEPFRARWLVFMHTMDFRPIQAGASGLISPMRGEGNLAEPAATYVVLYKDGTQERAPLHCRHQIGAFLRRSGENCFEAVAHHKPFPLLGAQQQTRAGWGHSQTRVHVADSSPWTNWLWAWENPHPSKTVVGIRFEPESETVVVSAISRGDTHSLPLRWQSRRKARLTLPGGEEFRPGLDAHGQLSQIRLDLGQIISATARPLYPEDSWNQTYNNQLPRLARTEVLLEYAAHPEACFHLSGGQVIAVSAVQQEKAAATLRAVAPATKRITFRAVEKRTGKAVPVKLHLHGESGEYLAPVDRHRILNPAWFEDYSVDFLHMESYRKAFQADYVFNEPLRSHLCTYIPGETMVDVPVGKLYVEVSKGFEIRPIRKIINVGSETTEIVVEIDRVLPWRDRGWVTADTHVHFLSPISALLEGSAEGVNVVNLLASQWGELMTNVGDFDGRSTWGSREAGGDGEYLVRVGTENRQHILGHISLLGYNGGIIAPMTTGGPNESALGDAVECLLTEWARQCRQQGGVTVLPHFPNPRAEHAASIVSGDVDAVEMTSWGGLYAGIDPYSLSDWYRYLNCGYLAAAVGGTDKMTANTAVGTVRTYARIERDQPFTYGKWMEAIRRAETFVTYGPLMEFSVDGAPPGSRIEMPAGGGTVDVNWEVASVTVPISRVELVVNGEIRESLEVPPWKKSGHWPVKIGASSWLALLVRGHYADQPEIVAAHSSPIMIGIEGSPLLAAADALTILEQIEGAMAYLDTVGTRAEEAAFKRMRLVLTAAHRSLHNRMHQQGYYHDHSPAEDHPEHHR